ncbi:MAG: sulfite exporter TauE/SafE family protein [Burkholderiales bacterium]
METPGFAQLAFCAVVVMVAFAVRGTTGFGGNAIAVPLLTLVLPMQNVVAAVTVLTVLSSLGHWLGDWRRIVWTEILRAAPFTLIGVAAGLYLFETLDARTLTRAFGGFVILYAIYSLAMAQRALAPSRKMLWPLAAVLCTLAGLVGTLFGGAAGPIYVIYLRTLQLGKDSFRVTITTILMTQAVMRVAGYFKIGFYDRATLLMLAAALPLMLAGAWLGGAIAGRIDQLTFNRIVGAVLLCSGIALLFK